VAPAAPPDAFVYWGNFDDNAIGRSDLDGRNGEQSVVVGAAGPVGIAVDGKHVYWANFNAGTIGRAQLDSTNATEALITTTSATGGLDSD